LPFFAVAAMRSSSFASSPTEAGDAVRHIVPGCGEAGFVVARAGGASPSVSDAATAAATTAIAASGKVSRRSGRALGTGSPFVVRVERR
jgi:hypothetical protein